MPYDPKKPMLPEKAPISKENDVPELEPTAEILTPPKPGWAPGGFDLPPPDRPSHVDVQRKATAATPRTTAPVPRAPVSNEPSGAPWSPPSPLPPEGPPNNWGPPDTEPNPDGVGWIDVQGQKRR